MNVFELIKEKLEKESDFFGGQPMGSLQKAYYCKGVEKAISIVDEVAQEYKQGNCANDCAHFDNAVQYGYNKAIERLEMFCEKECFGICPECEVPSAIEHLKAGGSDGR